jgi:hypothetical protein
MTPTMLPTEAMALAALVSSVGIDAAVRMIRPEAMANAVLRLGADMSAIKRFEEREGKK